MSNSTNNKGKPRSFEEKFSILKRHVKETGRIHEPQNYVDPETGFKLGGWLKSLRLERAKIDPAQRKMLVRLGFVWGSRAKSSNGGDTQDRDWRNVSFQDKLAILEKFVKVNKHAKVPHNFIDQDTQFKLGAWLCRIRSGKTSTSPKQKAMLDRLGFFFDPNGAVCTRTRSAAHDQQSDEEAISFAEEENSEIDDTEDEAHDYQPTPPRPEAKTRQRDKKEESRTRQANPTAPRDWRAEPFGVKLAIFKSFVEEHKHAKVPYDFVHSTGFKLGAWISRLRHGHTSASKAQWKSLDELGFVWLDQRHKRTNDDDDDDDHDDDDDDDDNAEEDVDDGKDGDGDESGMQPGLKPRNWRSASFEEKFKVLKRFSEANGHVLVPCSYVDIPTRFPLGRWVRSLRERENRLDQHEKEQLRLLKFVWRVATGTVHSSAAHNRKATFDDEGSEPKEDGVRKRKADEMKNSSPSKKTKRTEGLAANYGSDNEESDDVVMSPDTSVSRGSDELADLKSQFSLRAELDAEIQRLETKMKTASTLSPEQLSSVADEILEEQNRLGLLKQLQSQSLDKFKSLEDLEREKATLQTKYNATEAKTNLIKQRVRLAQQLSQLMERCKKELVARERLGLERKSGAVKLDPSVTSNELSQLEV